MGTKEKAHAFATLRAEEMLKMLPAHYATEEFVEMFKSFYVLGFADGHTSFVDEMQDAIDDGKETHHSEDLAGNPFSGSH